MPDNNGHSEQNIGMPVTAEDVGFRPDELIACEKCGRTCPPNRVKCIYCGAELGISPENLKAGHVFRRPESWESGINVVAVANDNASDTVDSDAAKILGIETDAVRSIIFGELPLPVARVETNAEAVLIGSKLAEAGIRTVPVSDEDLAADDLPRRLRAIDAGDDGYHFVHFGGEDVTFLRTADIALIVAGAIYERAVTSTEARKKGATKIIDSTENSSDESVIDIYLADDRRGFRVFTKGFDFSVLGEKKGILGRENLSRLTELLAASPNASVNDNYLKSRAALAHVWGTEEKRDSKGLTRQRFGKFDLSSVSTTSNLTQFTQFSRMLACLHGRKGE